MPIPLSLPSYTELDAVNDMLLMIGEMGVQSLDAIDLTTFSSASVARNLLLRESAEIQSAGYSWNTTQVILPIDANGFIWGPSNTLKLWAPNYPEIIYRDGKLFNTETNSYVFTKAVECVVIGYVDFDSAPFVFRKYVAIRTGRLFAKRMRQGASTVQEMQDEELRAKAAFDSQTAQEDGKGLFSNQSAQDHLNKFVNPTRYRLGVGGSSVI